MDSSKQIKFGALMGYFAIVVNIVAGLVYTPWMIDKIGQANYGLYTLATSLITMFIMDFGMSAAVSRFVSIYNAKGDRKGADDFMGLVYKLYLTVDTVILVALTIMYFFIDKVYKNLSPEEVIVFKRLFIIVAIYSIVQFPFMNLNGILTAHEKFIQLKACELFHKIIVILTVVAALFAGLGVEALVIANALSGILTILLKLYIIRKKTPLRANFRYFDKKLVVQIFGFSMWTTVSSLTQRLIFNITPSIITAVHVSGSVGSALFGLASTIEGYVYTFATAINGMFMPRISKIIVSGKKETDLLPLMIKIGRIQILITGLLTIGFIALGKSFVIDIWHKADFSESYICAVLLIIPSLFYLPMQIANTTLIVENKVRLQAIIFTIMGVLNVALSIPFSKWWGAIGASLSIFIAYSVRNILMAVTHHRVLKLNMFEFIKQTYLKLLPILLITLGLGFVLEYFNPISNIYIRFLSNGIVFVAVYFVLLWLFGLNDYEKNLFLSVPKRILKKII